MIKTIIEFLPYLFLAISTNILLGTYNSVFKLHETFNKTKFKEGIYKAIVISYGFVATSVIYDKLFGVIAVGDLEIAPNIILLSAIILYFTKATKNLVDILQVVKFIYPTPVEAPVFPEEDFFIDEDFDYENDVEINR